MASPVARKSIGQCARMSAERVGALFWIVFGGAAIYGALGLGLGTMETPGSGFLTFVAASFVTLMAVLVLIQSYRHDAAAQVRVADLWRGLKWGRAIAIVLLTILFILSFETVGFFVCSFALLVVIMRWLEGVDWKTSLGVPAITIAGTHLLFQTILKISLPAGILGF